MSDSKRLSDPQSISDSTAPGSFKMNRSGPSSREGSMPNTCLATILSCGLGGCNCNEGGVNTHMRCCRVDTNDTTVICWSGLLSCLCCCGCWTGWAKKVHTALRVDYYP
ncbi:hypothetical protein TrST_g3371 [Triparma strigata]|uniref:Uncharacterized protein n=1 Tax=Triparma strigata TaxID=1606541 RepID=A0A9W7BQL5_9STRA|nr:hypothetical protein TrST_g3371 [Triparma strigata]